MGATETPPRTWGRHSSSILEGVSAGNTPTHVGKTFPCVFFGLLYKKHPHARGEDWTPSSLRPSRSETPPRTWGRPSEKVMTWGRARNTPTHVGKTRNGIPHSYEPRKHPHARGEDACRSPQDRERQETPPRTWGRRGCLYCAPFLDGNTPTHVGKTLGIY